MPQPTIVSRRNLVTLAAGAIGAGTFAAAEPVAAAATLASPAHILAACRERVLHAIAGVHDAPGSASRARAFAALSTAVTLHGIAGAHVVAERPARRAGTITGLYRGADGAEALARVLMRELAALPTSEPAWMARFADLEALLRERVVA